MYSGGIGNKMRLCVPSAIRPANRLNNMKNEFWLPEVSATFSAVIFQP